MEPAGRDLPPRWLWRSVVGMLTVVLAAGVILSVALAAGWNRPQPAAPADWRASDPYTLEVAGGTVRQVLPLGVCTGAFALEAVITPLDGGDFNAYGLAFRAQDPARYAVFAAGSDGYLAVLWMDGDVETPLFDWQAFPHVRRAGRPNRLRVACGDGMCRFWVNDEHVVALPDVATGGELGLWARRFDPGPLRFRFTDVAVWRDTPPGASSCP